MSNVNHMMIAILGKDRVADYCLINAFKYRMRLGHKNSVEEDLQKEQWYLNKHRELKVDGLSQK